MAIAHDAASGPAFAVAASSVTLAHTCSGDDRILVVGGFANNTAGDLTATYNGVAMTEIASRNDSGSRITTFYLVAPATGANNIVLSWSGSAAVLRVSGSSYTGAAQSSQPDSSATGADATSPFQISTTTIADNCWVVGYLRDTGGNAMTVEAGTTNRAGSGTSADVLCDNNAAKTPAGSVTLGCTSIGSSGAQIIASIAPALPATGFKNLLLLGVG